jgi:hypothetical protein
VPTRLTLDVDGVKRVVTVPPIADQATENATAEVILDFPTMTGRKIRVTIDDVREQRALMFATDNTRLEPVGIAEIGVPGLRMPVQPEQLDSGCRDDLVAVDGKPLPVRVTGPARRADVLLGLTVEHCGENAQLMLEPGDHTLTTARGKDTGFSIDRLVLTSRVDDAPLVPAGDGRVRAFEAAADAPQIDVVENGRTSMQVRVTGATKPFWLVLGQSHSPGWHAKVVGGDGLGPPQLVDGYANGWLVTPTAARDFEVELEWTPQRQVWASIAISLITVVGCIGIVIVTARRRRRVLASVRAPGDDDAELVWTRSWHVPTRVRWVAPVVAGLLAALVVRPWVGLLVAAVTLVLVVWPRWRPIAMVVPGALLAVGGLYLVIGQIRYDHPSVFEWPTLFPRARTIAWIAVMLLVADAIIEIMRERFTSPRARRKKNE